MTPQELKDTGHRLFIAHRYAEAIPPLKSASQVFPEDESIWRQLVVSASATGDMDQAVEFAKQGIRQHPLSGWLWLELGHALIRIARLDEAEKALNSARSLNPNPYRFWYTLARLHQGQKNLEKEIESRETLCAFDEATSDDLNDLGIAYYNHRNFAKALEYYRLSAAAKPNSNVFFNMGLVFKDQEVSQDADAADAYRRALALKPDFEGAKEKLDATKRKLVPLAERAHVAATHLVQPDDLFRFYINPFEMLQIEAIESIEELDVRGTQRAKKRLMQEIELNDGKVSWLDDYPLDKSRALAVENELHDEVKVRFHWAVFQNKMLFRFLTRGNIEHFLYTDGYFPRDTLELLDNDPGFRAILSKPFASQYNLILTRAIEQRLLSVVEVLFDGRRWVEPEDEDICFEGASKRIGELVELMRSKANDGHARKVSLNEIKELLEQHSLPEIFNLLPTVFASAQRDVVAEIRSLAVTCFNEHGDLDLSRGVLGLCKGFTSRSVELTKSLEEDFKTIERMIAEERKHECRLTFGPDRPFEITKEGIRDGAKFFPASSIGDLRWGITITGSAGTKIYEYILVVRNNECDAIVASWSTGKSGQDKSTEYFSSMVTASMNYLSDVVLEKIQKRLLSGQQVVIGPCTMTHEGIAFQTQGLIFKKNRFVSWGDATTDIQAGEVLVFSKAQGWFVKVPMKNTSNAVLLPVLSAIMKREQDNPPAV